MDKVLPIIEKHVQWIALGLGALFLALMAYSYVAQTPVTVPVAGQELVPSKVDAAIAESPDTARLKREMNSSELAVPEAEIPKVPEAVNQFAGIINAPVPLPPMPPPRLVAGGPESPTKPPVDPNAPKSVPQIPAAYYAASSGGRGVYQWTPQVPQPLGVAAPDGGQAVDANGQPIPNPAAAPPAFVPPPQPVTSPLVDWTSHSFVISLAEMNAAFTAAGLDPAQDLERLLTKTAFLAVELHRQEKLPNGSWGSSTIVPPLPEFQPIMRPMPKPADPLPEKFAYTQWAAVNIPFVMQPTFPTAVLGTPWFAPGQPAPGQVGAGGEGAAAEGAPPPLRPAVPNPIGDFAPPPVEGGDPNAAGLGQIPGVGTPEGTFVPADVMIQAMQTGLQDVKVQVLAHDITVQPGKTYRYMLRYHVRNPLWQAPLAELPAAVRDLFAATSKDSAWTKEIRVAPRVEFFVKNVKPKRGDQPHDVVEMDVFFDRGGQWAPATMTFSAGDPIAGREGNSGWTVVDVRKDPRTRPGVAAQYYVIVADQNGQPERRDAAVDQQKDRLRELRPPVVPPAGTPEGGPINPGPGVRPPPAGRGFNRDA